MTDPNKPTFAVLFVDDEEKARKMFTRLVSPHFNVFTACDVNEAMALLKKEADHIGVLITDQRMPGLLGVDLLRHVRKEYPDIIRLLTTAYSDLSDAIEAVNTGEIFRYINKPWNVDELLIDLKLAMNFFLLQMDRNQLIREKLSVLQRQAVTNTLKNMISLAGGQTRYNQPLRAVDSFLKQLEEPRSLIEKAAITSSDYWTVEVQQSQKMLEISRSLNQFLNEETLLNSENQPMELDWNNSVDQTHVKNISLELNSKKTPAHLSQTGLNHIMNALAETFDTNDMTLTVSDNLDQNNNSIMITATPNSPDSLLAEQFLTLGTSKTNAKIANLLGVFILSYSVDGNVKLTFEQNKLNKIEINLPQASDIEKRQDIDGSLWMEDLFVLYS